MAHVTTYPRVEARFILAGDMIVLPTSELASVLDVQLGDVVVLSTSAGQWQSAPDAAVLRLDTEPAIVAAYTRLAAAIVAPGVFADGSVVL